MRERTVPRCSWAESSPLMLSYHDEEWGVPHHDDRALFELLTLEGAQAGLSWATILRKRPAYRAAFAGFDPALVARYDAQRCAALLADAGIVRNRAKIAAAVTNAGAVLRLRDDFGSFDTYLWSFVGGQPLQHEVRNLDELPATSPESDALSKDLKRRGFTFVGSTICYAFLQAAGLINDHLTTCFRWAELAQR
jgi:DNA-3-methyladenine glycosylase I